MKNCVILVLFFTLSTHLLWADQNTPKRPSAQQIQATLELIPEAYQPPVKKALKGAGKNGLELIRAITFASAEQREGVAFLLANMPRRDLRSISFELLIENVQLAYKVREQVPWGKDIPQDIFLNDVLPYASVNEQRDNWRADFYQRFLKTAQDSGTIEKTVMTLNKAAFETLQVSYDAVKRPKPDQSPYESMKAHYASCTGLSIVLVDVFRSVGIPSRLAGIPLWKDRSGNHTWVEVWDAGQWHHIGAAEPGPYDQAWFTQKASETDPSDPDHRIYAASFERTNLKFPLVWNPRIHYVYAVDVTGRYLMK
jgi:hypothetical protein